MLKIAIIGPGSIAGTYAQALADSATAKITAVLGHREQSAQAFSQKYGIPYYTDAQQMYRTAKPDAVLVCTPTFTHGEIVKTAIAHGVHIMCEKPFVTDAATAQQLFDLAAEKGVRLMVMQVVRFWPEYVHIKQLLDSGKAGKVHNVYLNRLSAHPDWCTWHKDPKKSGGGLYDLHIHDIDWLCHAFGRVKSVYAVGKKTHSGCWNNVSSTLRFENGTTAIAEGFMDITGEWSFSTNIRINSEYMAIEHLNKTVYNSKVNKEKINNLVIYHKDQPPQIADVPQYNPYRAECEYFARCVKENGPFSLVPASEVVHVLKVLAAIEKSLESGLVQNTD